MTPPFQKEILLIIAFVLALVLVLVLDLVFDCEDDDDFNSSAPKLKLVGRLEEPRYRLERSAAVSAAAMASSIH